MSQDPQSLFGNLLRACISDRFLDDEGFFKYSVLFTILGLASSVATVYVLSVVRFFV